MGGGGESVLSLETGVSCHRAKEVLEWSEERSNQFKALA